ncbi:MAG: hypothetical protein V2A76_11930 [Planctomycetota bacterium]
MFGNRAHPAALAARFLIPLCLLGLNSCDIEFPEQELHLSHDAGTDTLEMLIVYHGITAPSEGEEAVGKSVDVVKRLMQGEREFMLIDWPLYFEIDKWERKAREGLESEDESPYDREQAARYLQVAERMSLVSHALFLDEEGRLSGYQLFHVRQFSQVVVLLNQMISADILDEKAAGGLKADDELDEHTVQLVSARAESGEPWFTVDGDGIKVDLPFSLETTRKGRQKLVHELLESDDDDGPFADLTAVLAGSITSLSFEKDRCVGVITPDEPGRYDWTIQNPAACYSDSLLGALKDAGVPVREDLKIDQVRSLVR